MKTEYHDQILLALEDLKRYVDSGLKSVDQKLDDQQHTVVTTAQQIERVATVHVDSAMKLFRSRVLKFSRGIE